MAFESLAPLLNRLPAVSRPEGHVHFKKKLGWTLGILVLYFVLANIPLFGLDKSSIDLFELYRAFFAGASGSLMVLGIGPIVTASIVLQLLVGANVIRMDLTNPHQQAIFQGLQKLLVFVMIALEALPQILGGYMKADAGLAAQLNISVSWITVLLFIQICIGGVLILYMDEIVSKWGIGSGVGMFIIAGVSQQIVQGIFNWKLDETGFPIGLIPKWIYIASPSSNIGLDYLLTGDGILFLLVKGGILALPVKLIYASVLPMILVRALQANIQMVGLILSSRGINLLGEFKQATPVNGLMYYLSPIQGPNNWMPSLVSSHFTSLGVAPPAIWQIVLHVLTDAFMLIIGGIIFALFWIETTGMGAKNVAEKIQRSGMQIPGYRRSSGTLERVMQRYIPKVTVIGGAFIGLLTLIASLLGTLGGAGGTGLLLTVSIMYRLYEDIASQQMMEMHPMMRSFFGKE
ncbi:MAG: preprotein translocase subunit SecY [Candidatus Methanoperedens sp.]|nr:preprotein translocase subunit SecY [Candidatus Methanoperedens sp.]